jgi:hypothetical protein
MQIRRPTFFWQCHDGARTKIHFKIPLFERQRDSNDHDDAAHDDHQLQALLCGEIDNLYNQTD